MDSSAPDFPLLAGIAVLAYLLGSIPFGLLLARFGGHGDIRNIGSGNIGATNVLRTGSKGLALLTVLCDAGKGAVSVLIAGYFGEHAVMTAAIATMVGHIFPIWLGFRGGKGVATAGGTLLALAWPIGLGVVVTWLAVAVATRYSSLAALVAAILGPVFAYLWSPEDLAPAIVLLVLVVYRHKENIERLIAGTESKIGG